MLYFNGILFRKSYFDFLEPRSSAEYRLRNTGVRVGTHVLYVGMILHVLTYNCRFNSGGSSLVPQMAPLVQVSSLT
jgi:hypothetical protein